jgi:hypothetical protein
MSWYRALSDGAQFTVRASALVVVFAVVSWFAIEHARLRMAEIAAQQAVCRARLEALVARNAFTEKFVRTADPCLALEVALRP